MDSEQPLLPCAAVHKGKALSPTETRQLQILVEARDRAKESTRAHTEAVEDYVLELLESGSSVRVVAAAVGSGASTVQGWASNARRRRG